MPLSQWTLSLTPTTKVYVMKNGYERPEAPQFSPPQLEISCMVLQRHTRQERKHQLCVYPSLLNRERPSRGGIIRTCMMAL